MEHHHSTVSAPSYITTVNIKTFSHCAPEPKPPTEATMETDTESAIADSNDDETDAEQMFEETEMKHTLEEFESD